MGSGGARNRSGPQPDPKSGRSDRRGLAFKALPAEGYRGIDVPELTVFMPDATVRHLAVWANLWRTPQAGAWILEPWRWPVVADLVKWMVRSDAEDAPASIATSVRQLRDDCGLSAAGLKANGWKIGDPAPPEGEPVNAPNASNVTNIKSRLTRGGA